MTTAEQDLEAVEPEAKYPGVNNVWAELAAEIRDAMYAQAKFWADRGQRDRANEEHAKLFRALTNGDGITGHPKRRWAEGEPTFRVIAVPDATEEFALRHDFGPSQGVLGKGPMAGCIAPGAYHLVDGDAPEYEAVARNLGPKASWQLTDVASDRRNWLADQPKRVAGTEFAVIPVVVPWDGTVKIVAAESFHRAKFGLGYRALWVYDVPEWEVGMYHAVEPATEHSAAKAPWEVIDVAERHAFVWASQWAERIALDDEHTWGQPEDFSEWVNVVTTNPYHDRKVSREVAAWMDRSVEERRAARRSEPAGTVWTSKVDRKALNKALSAKTWEQRMLLLDEVMVNARRVEAKRGPEPRPAKVRHGGRRVLGAGPDIDSNGPGVGDDGFREM